VHSSAGEHVVFSTTDQDRLLPNPGLLIVRRVDMTTADHSLRERRGEGVAQGISQICSLQIYCDFFRTGFRPARRQYYISLL
jgi:hypothetical protein